MATLSQHPQFNRTTEANAALIEACGRVFAAAHAREESSSPAQRDQAAAASVAAFLDMMK